MLRELARMVNAEVKAGRDLVDAQFLASLTST
jgi:electron transfer flavoprotein alpha subunit